MTLIIFLFVSSINVLGSSQLRRVRLPRIIDGEGQINFDELVGLVVTFVFPEEQNNDDRRNGYQVKLTYLDSDEDRVTIGSSDELLDAVEQFAGKGVLRIQAEVKRKESVERKTLPDMTSTPRNGRRTNNSSTHPESVPEIPIQKMLESFVGVLSQAVMTLQEGLAAKPESSAAGSNNNEQGSRSAVETAVAAGASNVVEASDTTVPETEGRPFIHGRHTCGKLTV